MEKINSVEELKVKARKMREVIIGMAPTGFGPHVPSALSATDIVAALYYHTMNFEPENLKWPDRDRFILSAGHKSLVQYSVLNLLGVISDEEMKGWETYKSNLAGHPCYGKCPGIEASTGSLGHGLAIDRKSVG